MWEVPLGPQQSENVMNNILKQNSKPELSQYLHAALFITTTASLHKVIKQVLLKTWTVITEKLIKKHLDKSRNTAMGHLHMRRQGLRSTKEKILTQTWKKRSKQMQCFAQLWTLAQPKKERSTQIYTDVSLPPQAEKENKFM